MRQGPKQAGSEKPEHDQAAQRDYCYVIICEKHLGIESQRESRRKSPRNLYQRRNNDDVSRP
jgi:hypothetical protein